MDDLSTEIQDKRYVISDDETIYRLASHPLCVTDNDEISPDVFSLYHKNEDYVSVSRAEYINVKELLNFGKLIKKWPQPGETFCAILVLNAGEIRNVTERILLESKYKEGYNFDRSHAGISYILDNGQKLNSSDDLDLTPAWVLTVQQLLCSIVKKIIRA